MIATLDRLTPARPLVRLDGETARWPYAALQQLRVAEHADGMATLELTVENWGSRPDGAADLLFEDERELGFGREIEIAFFHGEASLPVFAGQVSAIEAQFGIAGPPRLTACAEDRLAALRLKRRSAVYESMAAGEVCARLAQDHGLSVSGATGFGHPQDWTQLGETDLGFMRRLARRHGLSLRLAGREIVVERVLEPAAVPVVLHVERDLVSLRLVADLSQQCSAVHVSGFDVAAGAPFAETSARVGGAPGRGRSGAEVLQQAFGERIEPLGHLGARHAAEARALAEAAFDARASRFVVAHGRAVGDPRIRVGADLDLQGAGPRFSNVYAVTRCEHRFTLASGYETTFEAGCAYLGAPA